MLHTEERPKLEIIGTFTKQALLAEISDDQILSNFDPCFFGLVQVQSTLHT